MIAWWIWAIIGVAVVVVAAVTIIFLIRSNRIGIQYSPLPRSDNGGEFYFGRTVTCGGTVGIGKQIIWASLDGLLNRAAKDAIRTGLLMFNIPVKMVQGEKERIARYGSHDPPSFATDC